MEKRITHSAIHRHQRLVYFFYALTTLWAIWMACAVELSDQEAYYWTWAKHLDLCYFEHPPLHAWCIALFTKILGDHGWVVRLPAFLGRAATLLLFYRWARERASERVAQTASLVLCGSFLLLAGSFLSLPDSVLLPFLLLTIMAAEKGESFRTGIYLGLAGLAKWTALLMVPGILYFFWKRPRSLRSIAIVGATALLFQTPVLYWNYTHHWASFLFHLHDRQVDKKLGTLLSILQNFLAFMGSQFVLGGLCFTILLIVFIFIRRKGHSRTLWAWILPPFLVFGFSALKGELRFYWTDISFLPLILLLAESFQYISPKNLLKFEKVQIFSGILTACLLSFILLFPVGAYLKPLTDTYKKYDLRHSPRGDLAGWHEFATSLKAQYGEQLKDYAILASDFRLASQLLWELKSTDTRWINVAFAATYQYQYWPHPSARPPKKAIFFADNRHWVGVFFTDFCTQPVEWKHMPISLKGEVIKTIDWAECPEFKLSRWAKDWSE